MNAWRHACPRSNRFFTKPVSSRRPRRSRRRRPFPACRAYRALVAEAEQDYEGFWARLAREGLTWHKPFTKVLDERNAPFYTWFDDGELNASYNCLDRHVEAGNGERVAVIFEADDGTVTRVTYADLLARVSRFANALKKRGIGKAIASSSTFRCRSKASSRCRPARASARRTRSCSAASPRNR